jgi:hypothetical protein
MTTAGAAKVSWVEVSEDSANEQPPATWYQTTFKTPASVAAGRAQLLVNATGLNRGRFWVNGQDIGRYFQLTRNDGTHCPPGTGDNCATQTYYHVPTDWLVASGTNLLTAFESRGKVGGGGNVFWVGLVTSEMEQTTAPPPTNPDEVISCAF